MKRLFPAVLLASLLLGACQTGQTQSEPEVIVVPPDEMSRNPSLGRATVGPSATPSKAPPTAGQEAPAYASISGPEVAAGAGKDSYNSCNVSGPFIAITFDDGPHSQLTPKLLDILKERGVRATFYVVGQNVVEYPQIMKRIAAEGHEIGNHSWNHTALSKLGADGVRKQIENTSNAVAQITGKRPATMRPPYGATNGPLNRRLNEQYGLKVIMWSVDPLDWKYRNAARVTDYILQNTRAGSIILVHDIHPTSVAAMPGTIDALHQKGYKFVTVSELLAMDRPPELVKRDAAPPAPATP